MEVLVVAVVQGTAMVVARMATVHLEGQAGDLLATYLQEVTLASDAEKKVTGPVHVQ